MMKEKLKRMRIILIIGIFLVVLGGVSTILYANFKKHAPVTVLANVTYVGNHYIVVEDDQQEEYSLETNEDYNIGDKISFTIKDIQKDSYPKKGTIEKIDTISKNVTFTISDYVETSEETTDSLENTDSSDDITDADSGQTGTPNEVTTEDLGEAAIISYFENLNTDLDAYSEDKTLSENIKSGFVTVVDFLFYEGTIKGKTFNQLSTTAKLKVLQLIFTIDQKIEKHFPDYKEQISTTGNKVYTNVKAKALESYLDLTTKICVDYSDTCQTAKEGLADLKQSFSLTWNLIKDISGIGLSKLKAWYELWRTV